MSASKINSKSVQNHHKMSHLGAPPLRRLNALLNQFEAVRLRQRAEIIRLVQKSGAHLRGGGSEVEVHLDVVGDLK